MREHRQLTREETDQVRAVKARAADFIDLLHEIGGTDPADPRMASRDLALAPTHLEDAAMRAVRHITS